MFASLLVSILVAVPASASPPIFGADVCALVEHLPSASSPIRRVKAYKRSFQAIQRAKGQIRKLSKARHLLERSSQTLLKKAQEVFKERDEKVNRRRVRRFLDTYVYSKTPSLVLRDEGFELPVAISTTLAWLRCREGDRTGAISYARPAHLEPGSLVAFAALLLLDNGRKEEALELRSVLGERGFLAPFIHAEFETESQEKLRFHRMAGNRTTRQAQRDAVDAQRKRYPALGGP